MVKIEKRGSGSPSPYGYHHAFTRKASMRRSYRLNVRVRSLNIHVRVGRKLRHACAIATAHYIFRMSLTGTPAKKLYVSRSKFNTVYSHANIIARSPNHVPIERSAPTLWMWPIVEIRSVFHLDLACVYTSRLPVVFANTPPASNGSEHRIVIAQVWKAGGFPENFMLAVLQEVAGLSASV